MGLFNFVGTNGNIGDPNNWQDMDLAPSDPPPPPTLPTAGDAVTFGFAMSLTGSLDVAGASFGSFGFGEYVLDVGLLSVAEEFDGEASIVLDSGTISVGGNEAIGRTSQVTFTQNGGFNSVGGDLSLGLGFFDILPSPSGTYILNAGTLSANSETVGGMDAGVFVQAAGSLNMATNLSIATESSSIGDLIVDGTLNVAEFLSTHAGRATVTIEHGAQVSANYIILADQPGGRAYVAISSPGTFVTASDIQSGTAGIAIGLAGAAMLDVTDGAEVISDHSITLANNPGAVGTLSVSNGATVFTQQLIIGGGFTPGGVGTVIASTGGVVTATNLVVMYPAATTDVTGGGSVVVGSAAAIAGAVNVGTTGVLNGAGVIDGDLIDNGTVRVGGGLSVNGGALVSGALTMLGGRFQASSLVVTATGKITGSGSILDAVENDGKLVADSGTLYIAGPITGSGFSIIHAGAALELASADSQAVKFGNTVGTLILDQPSGFTGLISGLAVGDVIDLANTIVTNALITGSTLTVTESGGQTLNYQVAGALTHNEFEIQSDGRGGTDLVFSSETPPTLSVAMSGTAQEGQTLTATSVMGSDGDNSATDVTYQWERNGTVIGTGASYLVAEADEGAAIQVVASFTDDAGQTVTATSNATSAVVDVPPTLSVALGGTAQEGQTLTAMPALTTDGDNSTADVTYQWSTGSTGPTYVVTEADEGAAIQVTASFTDDTGQTVTATSNATGSAVDAPPTLSVALSGTAQEGQTLTATPTLGTDGDNSATNVSYQWSTGTTGSTYVVTEADEGAAIQVTASFTDDTGQTVTATSNATSAVVDTPPTLSVALRGLAQEGQTLTATPTLGTDLDNTKADVTYQWSTGATGATYVVTEADEGQAIQVTASFTDDTGQTVTATSDATNRVVDAPPTLSVALSGKAQEGQTLTATPTLGTDGDNSAANVTYHWSTGTTGSTYVVSEADEGKAIQVVASFTDDTGHTVTATSNATSAVVDAPPTLSVALSGTAQEGHTLTATSILGTDGDNSAANVTYQWSTGATGSSYVATEADEGKAIQVVASFTDDTGQTVTATSGATSAVTDVPPTLIVSIAGTAQEGQTLTATSILGTDGDNSTADVTYQWSTGATGSTYVVTEADEGATIRVTASFTDDTGQKVTATSNATGAVVDVPPTLSVDLSGTAQEGQTLTATSILGTDGDNSTADVTYRWSTGATGSTYVVTEADEGAAIQVTASFTDDTGQTVTATSNATSAVVDVPPTLSVALRGTAREGQTLTATPTLGTDSDNTTADVTYQWSTGATGSSYVVTEADEGKTIQLTASFTDDTGQTVTATSNATSAVVDAPPTLTVSIAGTAQEGQTLTAIGIANSGDAIISYHWQILNGSTWKNIAGATGSTYQVTEANEGHQLRVTATSADADGGGASATSTPTASVVDIRPAVSVTVSGRAQQGQILTATANTASDGDGGTIAYQWQAFIASNWVGIAGATNSTYRATEADEGHQIRVLASFADDTGQTASATSLPTTPVMDVTPALSVTLSGAAQEGRTLTAHANVITDGDGGATIYQWQKLVGTTWTNIAGATASTYQVAETDEGYQIRVAAAFTDDTGQAVSATSAATASVIDINPTLSVTVSGAAQDGQTLTATGIANDLDAVVSFQWQELIGATWTNIAGATRSTYAVTEANEGRRLRVVATSSDSDGNGTSATSTTASVTDPAPTLTIANPSLFVAAGGSVSMPISVSAFDSDDKVSVGIAGLPAFETITNSLDNKSFSGSSVTLTAAEVNSGLTLHSSYGGSGQPVNVLTVTATDATAGERATSAVQTITVTDPPALGTMGLLAQYIASSFPSSGDGHWGAVAIDPAMPLPLLAQPQHA